MTITLATLAQATPQQVFDQAVIGVIRQGKRCVDPITGSCVYRGPDGMKCAAGHLMSDEEFDELREGNNHRCDWKDAHLDCAVPDAHLDLIYSLQVAHDSGRKDEVRIRNFKRVANRYNLSFDAAEAVIKEIGYVF